MRSRLLSDCQLMIIQICLRQISDSIKETPVCHSVIENDSDLPHTFYFRFRIPTSASIRFPASQEYNSGHWALLIQRRNAHLLVDPIWTNPPGYHWIKEDLQPWRPPSTIHRTQFGCLGPNPTFPACGSNYHCGIYGIHGFCCMEALWWICMDDIQTHLCGSSNKASISGLSGEFLFF